MSAALFQGCTRICICGFMHEDNLVFLMIPMHYDSRPKRKYKGLRTSQCNTMPCIAHIELSGCRQYKIVSSLTSFAWKWLNRARKRMQCPLIYPFFGHHRYVMSSFRNCLRSRGRTTHRIRQNNIAIANYFRIL